MSPSREDVLRFRSIVATRLGLDFDESKLELLADVLEHRVVDGSTYVYLERLERDLLDGELRELARELTVNETYFFRHSEQLEAFVDVALADSMARNAASHRISLLSAGSSSGEEAYTLAMVLREGGLPAGWTATIKGADLSPTVVERARAGRYTAWSLRDVPRLTKERWFTRAGKDFILDPSIRSMVTFYERNLTREDPELFGPELYDVVFCRNVVMYFTPDQLQRVIDRLARTLVPGGHLFLGHAETLRGVTHDFALCHTHNTFYYRKGRLESATKIAAATAVAVEPSTGWVDAVQGAAERVRVVTSTPSDPPPAPAKRPAELEAALGLLANERFDEALGVLASLPVEARSEPDALLLRAVLETHAGRVAEAETACHDLLALDEMNAGAHYVLALCRESVGDAKGANEHDRTAAYLDPTFAMPRLHLGITARRAGDNDTARNELERALVLLQHEDALRVSLFGGGFRRQGLVTLCRAELSRIGGDGVRRA